MIVHEINLFTMICLTSLIKHTPSVQRALIEQSI